MRRVKTAASYLLVAVLWVLHWLPLPALRALGWGLGRLLFVLARTRRDITLINLRLCFPEKKELQLRDGL